MPVNLMTANMTDTGLVFGMALVAASLGSALGVRLAAWLAMAQPGRWGAAVVLLVPLSLTYMPVVMCVRYLQMLPAGALETRLLRLCSLAGIEAVLATPLAAAFAYPALAAAWVGYGRTLRSAGATRWQATRLLLRLARPSVLNASYVAGVRVAIELGALLLLADRLEAPVPAILASLVQDPANARPDYWAALGVSTLGLGGLIAMMAALSAILARRTDRG